MDIFTSFDLSSSQKLAFYYFSKYILLVIQFFSERGEPFIVLKISAD